MKIDVFLSRFNNLGGRFVVEGIVMLTRFLEVSEVFNQFQKNVVGRYMRKGVSQSRCEMKDQYNDCASATKQLNVSQNSNIMHMH